MYSVAISATAGLCLSTLLTRLCRDIFLRCNIVDRPDRVRKLHATPVPRVGGVAIALAYLGAFGILLLLPLQGASLIRAHLDLVLRMLPALLVIFGTGLLDDLRGLSPKWKLLGQLLAALCAWHAGVRIGAVAGHGVGAIMSLPLTVLWLLACTNAFNLIDGLDGLAAGIGLFATVTTLCAALLHGNMDLALATAPLAGALIGFLRYNFNPASIFLGDCGSLSIGFLLGCYAVVWSQKSATLWGMTTPMIVLAVPIADVVLSIIRRFLGQKAIFGADRGHIHHRLLDLGLTPRRAVMIVYCFCALAASVSLVQSAFHNNYSAMFVLLFCIGTCIAIANLGYTEFRVAARLLVTAALHPRVYARAKGTFRDQVRMQMSLLNLQTALSREEQPSESFAGAKVEEAC